MKGYQFKIETNHHDDRIEIKEEDKEDGKENSHTDDDSNEKKEDADVYYLLSKGEGHIFKNQFVHANTIDKLF